MGIQCDKNPIIEESAIPYDLKWRAGIGTDKKPTTIQTPGDDYIEEPSLPPDPFGIRAAFLRSIDMHKPPKIEMPPIKKSKQAQYWDAINNNGVIWKTGNDDTRPETQAELQAIQNPITINEPNLADNKPNDFTISYTGEFVMNHMFTDMPVNGLPNIKL